MRKLIWLIASVIPPWLASEMNAPKWAILLASAPLFLIAMSLGDPDAELLGDASPAFRKGALLVLGAGGMVFGTALLILWYVLFPHS